MRRVIVQPRPWEDGHLVVNDNLGRVIPYRDEGVEVNLTSHISRLIKSGDLIELKQEVD